MELDTALVAASVNAAPPASSSNAQPISISRTRKHALNSLDPLYASLRDVNFAIVGTVLNRVARRLSDDYEVRLLVTALTIGSTSSEDGSANQRVRE